MNADPASSSLHLLYHLAVKTSPQIEMVIPIIWRKETEIDDIEQ